MTRLLLLVCLLLVGVFLLLPSPPPPAAPFFGGEEILALRVESVKGRYELVRQSAAGPWELRGGGLVDPRAAAVLEYAVRTLGAEVSLPRAADELSAYGLDSPALFLSVNGGAPLAFGRADALTGRRYAQFRGSSEVHLIQPNFFLALLRERDDLRRRYPLRDLKPTVVRIDRETPLTFRNSAGRWALNPGGLAVDQDLVNDRMRALLNLRVVRFHEPTPEMTTRFVAPLLSIVFDPDSAAEVAIDLAQHQGRRYLRIRGVSEEMYEFSGLSLGDFLEGENYFRERSPFADLSRSTLAGKCLRLGQSALTNVADEWQIGLDCSTVSPGGQRAGDRALEALRTVRVLSYPGLSDASELPSVLTIELRDEVTGRVDRALEFGEPVEAGRESPGDGPRHGTVRFPEGGGVPAILSAADYATLSEVAREVSRDLESSSPR